MSDTEGAPVVTTTTESPDYVPPAHESVFGEIAAKVESVVENILGDARRRLDQLQSEYERLRREVDQLNTAAADRETAKVPAPDPVVLSPNPSLITDTAGAEVSDTNPVLPPS